MADLRSDLERDIRAAFASVVLGDGVSLTHAEYIDRWGKDEHGRDMTLERMRALSERDVVDDWSSVTLADLERDNIAHMDAAGFRYYLPALMLSVIDCYDPCSMRVIGTLSGLYPKAEFRDHCIHKYSLLDASQKRVVARFLSVLPEIVELTYDDQKVAARACTVLGDVPARRGQRCLTDAPSLRPASPLSQARSSSHLRSWRENRWLKPSNTTRCPPRAKT